MHLFHPYIEAIEAKFWADLAKSLREKVVTTFPLWFHGIWGKPEILCAPTVKLTSSLSI